MTKEHSQTGSLGNRPALRVVRLSLNKPKMRKTGCFYSRLWLRSNDIVTLEMEEELPFFYTYKVSLWL